MTADHKVLNEDQESRLHHRYAVKEGTSSVLVQSELQESWWAEAMECYCSLRDAQDLRADGQTPYERRFNSPIDGSFHSET